MSGWGIAETAPEIEKIKAESADYLNGLNSCGEVSWEVYDYAFDFYVGLIQKAYELGKSEAKPHWIPCEERLPEEPFGCFVTVMDTNPITMEEFENILPYFVGWDGEQWNDGDGEQCPFEVIAWWKLPEPFKGVTE